VRRRILITLHFQGGSMTAGEIAAMFEHAWPTTTGHIRVLESAGLLHHERQGAPASTASIAAASSSCGTGSRGFRKTLTDNDNGGRMATKKKAAKKVRRRPSMASCSGSRRANRQNPLCFVEAGTIYPG
jgi:hypothetical protein